MFNALVALQKLYRKGYKEATDYYTGDYAKHYGLWPAGLMGPTPSGLYKDWGKFLDFDPMADETAKPTTPTPSAPLIEIGTIVRRANGQNVRFEGGDEKNPENWVEVD